jgi:hypothetical protein
LILNGVLSPYLMFPLAVKSIQNSCNKIQSENFAILSFNIPFDMPYHLLLLFDNSCGHLEVWMVHHWVVNSVFELSPSNIFVKVIQNFVHSCHNYQFVDQFSHVFSLFIPTIKDLELFNSRINSIQNFAAVHWIDTFLHVYEWFI